MLEQCDITTDNNYFIGLKSTGSRPPGETSKPASYDKFLRLLNIWIIAPLSKEPKLACNSISDLSLSSAHAAKATLSLASQLSALTFHFTEPILFESYFQAETSRSANGQTCFAEEDDLIRRSETIFIWGRNQNSMT